jgi:DNA ligase (NAD+)
MDVKWEVITGVINSLDYPMDGIVIKLKDNEYAESLGATAHHPRGAIAFKFENVKGETELIDVEWGMGKENITATAIFSPIDLNGVTISKAVIPMNSKTLPCIYKGNFTQGSKIVVERAGDVIPHIVNVETNTNGKLFTIDKCPFCNGEIEVTESAIKCVNDNCRKKLVHKLYDALVILGIKNVGEKNVDMVCEHVLEKNGFEINLLNWMTLFQKTPHNVFNTLNKIPRFGEKSIQNIIDATNNLVNTTIAQFIAALGIPNVGIKIGAELEKKGNLLNILNLSEDDLANYEGIGEVMATRLHHAFQDNYLMILELASYFNFISTIKNSNNQSICFTGAMNLSRNEMSNIAQNAGFNVLNSVTKDLNVLVIADNVDMSSSKCQKALKYGTNIIREKEFLEKFYYDKNTSIE